MKLRLLSLFLVVAICGHAANPPSTESHITIAGRDVAMWKAAGAAPASGFPLIVFSHGFGGCNTQSVFLMEALARAGYFVLAPNHHDAGCGTGRHGFSRPEEPFRDDSKWSDSTYRDRHDDIEAVLDAALRDKTFQGVAIDGQRVGLAGHSLGGYTVLGVAGGWPSWKDRRVKAVLALSPYCSVYAKSGDLGHLQAPVMYQGGTRDLGITPTVRRLNGAYDKSSAPKYYVEFDGAGHFAWTNLNPKYQEIIDTYSVAFFDRYLKERTNPDPLAALTGDARPKGVSYVKAKTK